MQDKLETVGKGLSGQLSQISCTALSLEYQASKMEHDLFSGNVVGVQYMDEPQTEEVVQALNDDQDIDDILQQISDPLS